MGIARLDVSVIVEVPTHGDADASGAGTVISGLRPAPVVALGSGSVESVLLTEDVATGAVGVGLQKPDMFDVANEDVTGSGATDEVNEDVNPAVPVVLLESTTVVVGVVVVVVVGVLVAELVIAVVGHIVIAPRDVPGIGPKFPRLNCTAPSGLPAVPTVGIVPGTAVGNLMGVAVGDVVGMADPRREFAEPTWATAVPQPINTTANIVRNKRCIKPP